MNDVALIEGTIPAMTEEAIDLVRDLEAITLQLPQVDVKTTHVLHGGMYARTVLIPAGVMITGVLIKVETILIVAGDAVVYIGEKSLALSNHSVLRGAAGRKQVFVAQTDTHLTMIFPTKASTVEEAENEFTDEPELLITRRDIGALKEMEV